MQPETAGCTTTKGEGDDDTTKTGHDRAKKGSKERSDRRHHNEDCLPRRTKNHHSPNEGRHPGRRRPLPTTTPPEDGKGQREAHGRGGAEREEMGNDSTNANIGCAMRKNAVVRRGAGGNAQEEGAWQATGRGTTDSHPLERRAT